MTAGKGSTVTTDRQSYEEQFSDFFSAGHAFAFWKGRVALYAILRALGVGEGDQVIVPGYTCVMNVNPIAYVGANPVYVDVEPHTFNMDPSRIEKSVTGRSKVLIAQHTYGYSCDMGAIQDMARRHGLTLIEDCCLALGSRYEDRLLGTFGRAAYFSSQWNKPFTTGLGGVALTDDAALAADIQRITEDQAVAPSTRDILMLRAQLLVYRMFIYPRTTALAQNAFRALTKMGLVVGSSSTAEFAPKMADDFFRVMGPAQARAGLRQVRKLGANIEHRKNMTALYDRLLSEKGWPTRRYDRSRMDPVLVRYPVRIAEKDKALHEAAGAGVELGSWFECPLHPIETPLGAYGYEPGMCPEAERASRETVNLPLHPRVNERTVRRTVDFIARYTPIEA